MRQPSQRFDHGAAHRRLARGQRRADLRNRRIGIRAPARRSPRRGAPESPATAAIAAIAAPACGVAPSPMRLKPVDRRSRRPRDRRRRPPSIAAVRPRSRRRDARAPRPPRRAAPAARADSARRSGSSADGASTDPSARSGRNRQLVVGASVKLRQHLHRRSSLTTPISPIAPIAAMRTCGAASSAAIRSSSGSDARSACRPRLVTLK